MRKNRKKNKGKIIREYFLVFLTVVMTVGIGIFCTSSAKDAASLSRPPMAEETEETEETEDAEETGDETELPEITIGTGPVIVPEDTEKTEEETDADRVFIAGEEYVGSYESGGISINITTVNEGDLNYFICDIRLSDAKQLRTAFANGVITGRAYTSRIAEANGAVFAVNGDFCGFRTEGVIIREGKLYRNKSSSWDLCYIDAKGDMHVGLNNSFDGKELAGEGVLQSWCFGPTLVTDYKAVTAEDMNRPGLSSRAREPRTAIGQVGRLHYVILVVDAVRTSTETLGGMTFSELAAKMEELGCRTAYNLDGGGSTTLYFMGKVINKPCVNGERSISDIIYIK